MNFGSVSTKDGLETVFGGNFVGHFCLTTELMPVILSTPGSRWENVKFVFYMGLIDILRSGCCCKVVVELENI